MTFISTSFLTSPFTSFVRLVACTITTLAMVLPYLGVARGLALVAGSSKAASVEPEWNGAFASGTSSFLPVNEGRRRVGDNRGAAVRVTC
jgi:hypothetical protein